MDYQHDRQSVHLIMYHLVWCPKKRRCVLVGPVQKRLEQIIHEIIDEQIWQLIELAIQPDHVHLFVRTNPSTLPSDIPRLIKGRSSRLLRREFAHVRKLPALWSPSYFLSTAGNVSSETIERSIQQQSENEKSPLIHPTSPKGTPIHPCLKKSRAFWVVFCNRYEIGAIMAKVAVTGCSSRFAQVLLPLLEADADIEQIVGIDIVAPAGSYSKLQFQQRDVRDTTLKEPFTGCDAVVHLAFIVGRPYAMPLREAAAINLGGTWATCRAAAEAGVRKLVVSSSIAAYGELPDNPALLLEDSPLRGLYTDFYYNQHKHANEIWLDSLQLEFPQLLISRVRPSIVMGPHQSAASSWIQPGRICYVSQKNAQLPLQLVHEDDLASAFYAFIKHDLPGAYNVVGDGPDTLPNIGRAAGVQVIEVPHDTIVQAVTASWQGGQTAFGPEWVSGEGAVVCSNEKLKQTGVWKPRYTTIESYAATVAVVS